MTATTTPRNTSGSKEVNILRKRTRYAWLFLAPMLVVMFMVAAWPLMRTFLFSVTDVSINNLSEYSFTWLENFFVREDYGDGDIEYYGLLADPLWWRAVWNTVYFAVVSVTLETLFGLGLAVLLNTPFPGIGIVRAAILIPWAIPTIVSAKMWAWMLNDQFGIINAIMLSLGMIDKPIAWVSSIDTAMIAVIVVDVWKTTPFMALLILAGMQLIPKDIYEAGKIDRCTGFKAFWNITLPLLKPTIGVAVIFRMLDALRVFDLIYVLTPNNEQTITMSIFARQYLFEFDKFAYGSAASVCLFLIIGLSTIFYIRASNLKL